jgi:hypothetical protein
VKTLHERIAAVLRKHSIEDGPLARALAEEMRMVCILQRQECSKAVDALWRKDKTLDSPTLQAAYGAVLDTRLIGE